MKYFCDVFQLQIQILDVVKLQNANTIHYVFDPSLLYMVNKSMLVYKYLPTSSYS